MRLSTLDLLAYINLMEKFTNQDKYIILTGQIFPFFFLQFFKKILIQKLFIKKWLNIDIEKMEHLDNHFSFINNFHYYKENQTAFEYNQEIGFIIEIKEKNELPILKKILESKSDNYFYFIFIHNLYENNLKDIVYYSLDDIIYDEQKMILINLLRLYYCEEFFLSVNFFLKNFYKKIEKYARLEILFNIFQYIFNIKKKNISNFIDHYIFYSVNLLSYCSIFDLATSFFQKKISIFFEQWFFIKDNYSLEFWYYFWQDQLWYAHLALINKNDLSNIIFYKKVNRWFLKTGINYYKSDELFFASLMIYKLDYLYKKFQTNGWKDIESFFYIWFK